MKASLVSATSVAALLALGGSPAFAAANLQILNDTASTPDIDFGNTLVNCSAFGVSCVVNTVPEKGKNLSTATEAMTFQTPPAGVFTGGGVASVAVNATASKTYTFSPTGRVTSTQSLTVTVTGQAGTASKSFNAKGTGVAPLESVAVTNSAGSGGILNSGTLGYVLVGDSASAAVTVKNTGDGNKANYWDSTSKKFVSQSTTVTNLDGKQSFSGGSVFSGPGTTSISLNDSASQTFTYVYTPTQRTGGATQSMTATSAFTNGSSQTPNAGANKSETVTTTINGIAVAPVQSTGVTNSAGVGGTANSGKLGYVLVGQTASATFTVSNTGDGNKASNNLSDLHTNLQGTVTATPTVIGNGFTGSGPTNLGSGSGLPDTSSSPAASTTQSVIYTYQPTKMSGGPVASPTADTMTVTASFANGHSTGTNQSDSATTTLTGTAVAPVNSTSKTNAGIVRYTKTGTNTGTASVTVSNVGNGNLAGKDVDDGGTLQTNLHGTILAPSPSTVFTGPGPSTISLQDSTTPSGTTSATFTYKYTPTARGTDSSSVTVNFINGSTDQTNSAQSVPLTISGQGVGPTYQSQLSSSPGGGGTINTPPANAGAGTNKTISYGTVGAFSGVHKLYLDLTNISTDPNGGDLTKTDLSILSYNLTGSSKFSLGTDPTGQVLDEFAVSSDDFVVEIDFTADAYGLFTGLLTLMTDEDAPFGIAGDSRSYHLSAFIQPPVPEPGSLLLLSVGVGGVFVIRRRSKRRQAAWIGG